MIILQYYVHLNYTNTHGTASWLNVAAWQQTNITSDAVLVFILLTDLNRIAKIVSCAQLGCMRLPNDLVTLKLNPQSKIHVTLIYKVWQNL